MLALDQPQPSFGGTYAHEGTLAMRWCKLREPRESTVGRRETLGLPWRNNEAPSDRSLGASVSRIRSVPRRRPTAAAATLGAGPETKPLHFASV